MNTIEQWQGANVARAALYRWFAELFAHELTPTMLNDWQEGQSYANIHQAFCHLGLENESQRVQQAIDDLTQYPPAERALELAADFAQLFLLSGKDSAPPYASYYLHQKRELYGESAQKMRALLASQQLMLHPNFREPDDHLSVYLYLMNLWMTNNATQEIADAAREQKEFLERALLPWLPDFVQRCQSLSAKHDFYAALVNLLLQFIEQDKRLLTEVCE